MTSQEITIYRAVWMTPEGDRRSCYFIALKDADDHWNHVCSAASGWAEPVKAMLRDDGQVVVDGEGEVHVAGLDKVLADAAEIDDAFAALPSIDDPGNPDDPIDIFFLPTVDPKRIGSDELSIAFIEIAPQPIWNSRVGNTMSKPAAQFEITPRRYSRHNLTGTISMTRGGWEELHRRIGAWLDRTRGD